MIQLQATRHNPCRLNSGGLLGARRCPLGQRCAPSLALGLSMLGNEGATMSCELRNMSTWHGRGVLLQFILKQEYCGVRLFFGSLNLERNSACSDVNLNVIFLFLCSIKYVLITGTGYSVIWKKKMFDHKSI